MDEQEQIRQLKKDKYILMGAVMASLILLAYVTYQGMIVNNACNAHWIEQMKNCVCTQYGNIASAYGS